MQAVVLPAGIVSHVLELHQLVLAALLGAASGVPGLPHARSQLDKASVASLHAFAQSCLQAQDQSPFKGSISFLHTRARHLATSLSAECALVLDEAPAIQLALQQTRDLAAACKVGFCVCLCVCICASVPLCLCGYCCTFEQATRTTHAMHTNCFAPPL